MVNNKMLGLGKQRSIIREIFEYAKLKSAEIGKENVFDFSLGNPSVEPPKEISDTIIKLINSENPTSLHGYTSAQGDANVRKAIAESIVNRFGVEISPDYIYMTCGAAASLTITLKAIFNHGDECIVFAPFFTEYRVFIENCGGIPVISMPNFDNLQIDFEDFESRINAKTRAIILNSPNNPSGVVYTEETIAKVSEILRNKSKEYGHDIVIICDEPYRELVYEGAKVPYIMNYYDNSIVCYSFSKSLSLPGERIGYIAVNPKATESRDIYLAVCGAGRSLGYVCAPSLFQKIIGKCINCKVDIAPYKKNKDLIYNSLTEMGYNCIKPDGAFYLFVKTPTENAYDFYEKAKELNVLVVPCDDFGLKGYIRIAYCVKYETISNSLPYFKKLSEYYNLK